jgi:hypothetical protein
MSKQVPVTVDVLTMRASNGTDYYVRLQCGGRETTPFKFAERWKAAYEADHLAWVLHLRPDEPCILAYGPESHPNT